MKNDLSLSSADRVARDADTVEVPSAERVPLLLLIEDEPELSQLLLTTPPVKLFNILWACPVSSPLLIAAGTLGLVPISLFRIPIAEFFALIWDSLGWNAEIEGPD